jgi:hypothetical protein
VSASFFVRSQELRDAEVEERHLRGRALQGAVVGADAPPVAARARAQRAPGLAGRGGRAGAAQAGRTEECRLRRAADDPTRARRAPGGCSALHPTSNHHAQRERRVRTRCV